MLKRGFLVLMLATGLAACDDDSPTAPADPNLAVFTSQLSAQNEVGGNTPVSTGLETGARGDVRIEFQPEHAMQGTTSPARPPRSSST